MQFMAYSAAGRGGFYIGVEDTIRREKWLNFYRHADGDLRLSVWHSPTDYAERRDVVPGYSTVLAALDGGAWYDAADRYKTWALQQSWVAPGPLWAREDCPRWLYEKVGLCTFGINARHNRAPWLAEIDRIAGTPVMHILGPNWTRIPADYQNHVPGGLEDWFPTQFHPENLAVARRNGDYVAPFEFDLLFKFEQERSNDEAGVRALQDVPRPTLSRDEYIFPFMCPASSFLRYLHVARNRMLIKEARVNGVYYDISVNNTRHNCLSDMHDHTPGETAVLTAAYRTILADTAFAMREAANNVPIPQGTETITEQMLLVVAFYQARAEASPAAPFEAMPFRGMIKDGVAEKIPLFTYVYHDYGSMCLGGWAKLSKDQGDFIYFVLGRVFVQGGLIELNYEFSPLENLGEHRDSMEGHYYPYTGSHHYALDHELARFVHRLAQARVGRANRYLAYGTMLRPAPMRIDGAATLTLSYFLYNGDEAMPEYEEQGLMSVPTVLQVAWRYKDESIAWILLNLALEDRTAHIDPQLHSVGKWTQGMLTLHREGEKPAELGEISGFRNVTLTLPSRWPS